MASQLTIAKPQPTDSQSVLLYKLAYYLMTAAGTTSPTTMGLPSMVPNHNDSQQWLTYKAAYWASQISSGGGGGAGTDYILEFANQAALPAAPADTTKVWLARFRDGSAGKTWSAVNQAWF